MTSPGIDPKPICEASYRLAYKVGGWLAGEIWLKSAGLHQQKHGWLA